MTGSVMLSEYIDHSVVPGSLQGVWKPGGVPVQTDDFRVGDVNDRGGGLTNTQVPLQEPVWNYDIWRIVSLILWCPVGIDLRRLAGIIRVVAAASD